MRPFRSALIGLLAVLLCVPHGTANAQLSPSKSVFQIVVMEYENQGPYRSAYHSVSSGTAFFISPDGTALTNSHAVYEVRAHRSTDQLLAIVGNEFFGAKLVCASALPQGPAKAQSRGAYVGRDVAEIRVTPARFDFDQLTYRDIPYARAHTGPLQAFPALSLGPDPAVGDAVRILGFGHLADSPLPYEWSAKGTVGKTRVTSDKTPVFEIAFTRDTEPGHSGSPVLNPQDQVVGLFTWQSLR